MSEKSPAAFVGLGVMGYPMAGHLPRRASNAAYTGLSANRRNGCRNMGVTGRLVHIRPAEAAEGADYVMTWSVTTTTCAVSSLGKTVSLPA